MTFHLSIPRQIKSAAPRGNSMLVILILVACGSIFLTAALHLMAARLQQTERMATAVQRHLIWSNTQAINNQYAYRWPLRDNVTRVLSTATLSGWGGMDADAFTNFSVYRSTVRPSNTTSNSFPFNNITYLPTADNGTFFARTTGDSDSSQVEHLTIYNYLKTYPTPLLGDVLIIHKRGGGTGTYDFDNDFRINGRVVVLDDTAVTSSLRATSCLSRYATTAVTTLDNAGTALQLPQNFPTGRYVTAGHGGTAAPGAVRDGTLKMCNNTDFTPGSIRHIMEATGAQNTTWRAVTGTSTFGNAATDPIAVTSGPPSVTVPTGAAEYAYTVSGTACKECIIRLDKTTLTHVRIDSAIDNLIIYGTGDAAVYTNMATMSPIIIWVDQKNLRGIYVKGESPRRVILACGNGDGTGTIPALYMQFLNNAGIGASSTLADFYFHLILQGRKLWLDPGTNSGVTLTGGIRTNSPLKCTDNGNSVRFTFERDTSPPAALISLMPRDGWLEPYFLVR
ncbi:MAG: hypothetical protein ACOYMN_01120 [Roseimicrobium sp.]